MSKKPYGVPVLRELGALEELTRQLFNKIGPNPDSQASNPEVVGSLKPL